MALSRARRADMPPDAITLTEEEAIKYQINMMQKWKNKSDTFFFMHGAPILGVLSGLSGIYINNYYRSKLHLHDYGRVSSYLPIAVLPSVIALFLHSEFVLTEVSLQKSCAVCVQMRASAIQAFTGCVLPTILAPISAIALATQFHTYDVPYITREPLKVLQLWKKITNPLGNILFAIFAGQALLASTITMLESRDVRRVSEKLSELEYNLEHQQT